MALYEVVTPDGSVYQIEGPDNISEKQIASAVRGFQYDEETQARVRQLQELSRLAAPAPEPEGTTFGGQALEAIKGVPSGVVSLLEQAGIGASALLPEELEKIARTGIGSVAGAIQKPLAPAPGYEESVVRKGAQALGSTVPSYALALLGPAGIAAAGALTTAAGAGEARTRAEEAGATPEERRTATQLGIGVGLTELIPLEKFRRGLGAAGGGNLIDMGKRVLAQGGIEGFQEWAANTAQNLIAKGVYDPEQGVFTNSGEAAGYGAGVGGLIQGLTEAVLGRRARGTAGAPTRPVEEEGPAPEDLIREATRGVVPEFAVPEAEVAPEPEAVPAPAPAPVVAPTGEAQDIDLMRQEMEALERGEPIPEAPVEAPAEIVEQPAPVVEPVAPVVEPEAPVEAVAPTTIEQPPVRPARPVELPEGVVLQNRERSTPASVAQMNSIANDPDYSRLSFSNSFTDGAPVVFGAVDIPADRLGRQGTVSPAKGEKIPVQYAVVEATDILPSNRVDGSSIPEYADPNVPALKAVTNGRVAGIQESYRRNTAGKYVEDLLSDDIHGINPDVIRSMSNPVLVRVMPQDRVTKDIADQSNTPSTLALSPTERAKNDANRIDLEAMRFSDEGDVNFDTVRDFVASMPDTERNELIDKQGRPTKQAYDRLNNAVFSKAYQNDSLIALAAEAKDQEAANVIKGLSQAGSQMSMLDGKGEYDIRPQVVQAAEMAINARRRGIPLKEAMAEQDMLAQDPVSSKVLELFANNPRSAKKIGDGLRRIADAVNAEAAVSQEPDLLGEVAQKRPVADVVAQAAVEPEEIGLFAAPRSKEELDARKEQIFDEKIESYRATEGKKVSAQDFMSQAKEALANRNISQEVYEVVDRMFKKNPKFFDGLSLTTPDGEAGIMGQFDRLSRTIMLFKNYGSYDAGTLRHEITHSMEQMMSPEARKKVFEKWKADLNKAKDTDRSEQAQKYFKAVEDFVAKPSKEALEKAYVEMPSYEYYQFLTPSEYWAVNAEKLMASYLGGPWQRFKTAIRGMIESIKDVLGLDNQSIIYQTFKDTINGERKDFVVLANYIGSGIPLRNIERKNYQGLPAPLPTWESPPEAVTKYGNLSKTKGIYRWQDKLVDLKDVQKAIKNLSDFTNTYVKESLYYGRVAQQKDEFLSKELRPVLQELESSKITPQELDAYLLAKHAPERNARIAKINPSFKDGGSGISTAQAEAYLKTLSPEKTKQLESVNKKIRSMIKNTQKIEVAGGLESQDTIDGWNAQWENYVPLFREELDYVNGGSGLGRGFDVRGPSSKRAVGSSRDIKNILNSIMEQREKAIVRAEKNRIGQSLYALSIANPNSDFWLPVNPDAVKNPDALKEELVDKYSIDPKDAENLMEEPKVATVVRVKQPDGTYKEMVKYVSSPNAKFSNNVFGMRVNGKNRYVIFNPNNERANRLAESLKNLDAEQLDYMTQKVGNVTRWIASMSTQYNPIFGLWNFARDIQGAALNLTTTPLKGKQAAVMSDAFKFLPSIYKEYRAQREGKETTGDVADLVRKFRKAGGQTGYAAQFTKAEESGTILERELKRLNPGNVRKVVDAVGGWLSDYNDVLENAVRLSAFNQALKMDMSEQQAASLAKELTVNFNRKGAKTPGLSALFAFFNAAVQGTTRMVETLKGPAKYKIIGGGLLLGAVQALALQAFDYEEDDPTEFIKQKNLIIPLGGKNYLTWPMPLGFNFLPNIGRILTEMVFRGEAKARDRVIDLMDVMVDAFNPLGGAGFMQTLSPTILDPIIGVIENRDAFGRPISREDQATRPTPGYLRSRENSSEFSKLFSEALNYISGGTEFTKGIVSPTADDIDYVIGQYLGGVGREAQRFYELGKSQFTGEELEQYRIPLFGKIYGTTESPAATSNRFYKAVTRLAEHENEIKGRAEKGEDVSKYFEKNPEAGMYRAANQMENRISRLNKQIREMQKRGVDEETIESLKEQKTAMMNAFLESLKEVSGRR